MNRAYVSRACHQGARAAGPETSVAMRRIIILSFTKFIPAPRAPGFEDSSVPGFFDPDGSRNHLFSSRSFVSLKIYFSTLSLRRRTSAPPRKVLWVLGCWVVVCVKADYFPGGGGVGSLRLRPLFVPSTAVPSRPPRLFWIKSIYRPLASLSSLPLSPPMMRRTHSFMAVLARLARVRH